MTRWVVFAIIVLCSFFLQGFECGKALPSNSKSKSAKDKDRLSEPAAGWCRTKHKPPKAAQSSFDGYCKACFKAKHPRLYAATQKCRKKICKFCNKAGDTSADGFCRPCVRARSCDVCRVVSTNVFANPCTSCNKRRGKLGATQNMLALWCLTCTTVDERASSLCRRCYKLDRR